MKNAPAVGRVSRYTFPLYQDLLFFPDTFLLRNNILSSTSSPIKPLPDNHAIPFSFPHPNKLPFSFLPSLLFSFSSKTTFKNLPLTARQRSNNHTPNPLIHTTEQLWIHFPRPAIRVEFSIFRALDARFYCVEWVDEEVDCEGCYCAGLLLW